MNTLQQKIDALWDRLDIAADVQQNIQDQVPDHTSCSMEILKAELDRCEILKFEHLQEFTLKVRQELVQWWDKCHYSRRQRDSFSPFKNDEFTEELLVQHEDALEAVKLFYSENEQLLRKIEKRTDLWNRMVMFDEKENDPNRFRNRGGNLLVEEREKKKVVHQLPKVEEQLKTEIEEWEQENNRQFLIGGVQFFEFCRLQWEEYKQTKELQKQQRLEQKEKDMQSEIRYGSKPTPSKRRFCAGNTPSATPKQRKLNDTTRSASRLQSMSKMHSVFTSPAASSAARTPLRQSKTTSSLLMTPGTGRKPPITRTPASIMAPPRTPMSAMGPPRTPMSSIPPYRTPVSTRSTARKNEMKKAKSCVSLASPTLQASSKDPKSIAKGVSKMKRVQSEMRINEENTTPISYSSNGDIAMMSTQSSEVEPIVSSYEEFENVLHSAKKSKQYRSTICPPK